jgi:hypothetical protein
MINDLIANLRDNPLGRAAARDLAFRILSAAEKRDDLSQRILDAYKNSHDHVLDRSLVTEISDTFIGQEPGFEHRLAYTVATDGYDLDDELADYLFWFGSNLGIADDALEAIFRDVLKPRR